MRLTIVGYVVKCPSARCQYWIRNCIINIYTTQSAILPNKKINAPKAGETLCAGEREKISPGSSSSGSHPPGQSQRELFVSIFGRALCCLRASAPFARAPTWSQRRRVCVCSGNIGPCIQYFNTDIGNWHMREENTSKELHWIGIPFPLISPLSYPTPTTRPPAFTSISSFPIAFTIEKS